MLSLHGSVIDAIDQFPLFGSQSNTYKADAYEVKQIRDYLPESWQKYLRAIVIQFSPYKASEDYYCIAEVVEQHRLSKKNTVLIKCLEFPLKGILFGERSDEHERLLELEECYRFVIQANICHERATHLKQLLQYNTLVKDYPKKYIDAHDKITQICKSLVEDIDHGRVSLLESISAENDTLIKIYEHLEKEYIAAEAQKISYHNKATVAELPCRGGAAAAAAAETEPSKTLVDLKPAGE